MLTLSSDEAALQFAQKHVAVWNSHELDRIINLYSKSAELFSPLALALMGSAPIRGRVALLQYFEKGLAKYPDLHFELQGVFRCIDSLTLLFYGAGKRLVAEVMFVDSHLKIERVFAHYPCDPPGAPSKPTSLVMSGGG